ncbi:MAG TPA: hypothetical protein VFI47_00170 [Acidimicrobiales bacterium]|nr:hypothetical protein [Acidimicrobiales bacterium]
MLAGLLPGVRQLRAPLSAGYLWLLAAWVAFEPLAPERSEASGVIASLYRASDLVSAVGLGIAVSFAGYLLGSVSTSALTPILRRAVPRAWDDGAPRSPLSPAAGAALTQVARTGRERLGSSLALSGTGIDRFLEDQTGLTLPETGIPRREPAPGPPRSKRYVEERPGPGWARPIDLNARREALLALLVLKDLPVVATTRLLGRDQELYSAVDRNRAEVEFRFAVIPPLLVLVVSVGARSEPWILALLVPVGAMLAWALFADALRSERAANEILMDSLADGRVASPTLERLETRAATLAGEAQPERMSRAAKDASLALQGAAASLEVALASEPGLATFAQRQIVLAQEPLERVRDLFPPATADTGSEALRLLAEVADAWVRVIDGHGPTDFDVNNHLLHARKLLTTFQAQAHEAMNAATVKTSPVEPDG